MNDESRLAELLSVWQRRHEQGEDTPTANLCRDCPDLGPELERRIQALRDAGPLLPGGSSPVGTTDCDVSPVPRPPIIIPEVPGYELLEELGRGGMGVVFKARHLALKRSVALKMILVGPHASAAAVERFRAEAEVVARLQHPNIVQIFDVGVQNGLPYLALEFCEGGNLDFQGAGPGNPGPDGPPGMSDTVITLPVLSRTRRLTVQTSAELLAELRKGAPPGPALSLFDETGTLVKSWDLDELTLPRAPTHWGRFAPGVYKGWLYRQGTEDRVRQLLVGVVDVRPGPPLWLSLTKSGGQFRLERAAARQPAADKAPGAGAARGWKFTVHQSRFDQQEDALRLTVTADKLRPRAGGEEILTDVQPRLILFRVKARDNPEARPPSLRCSALADAPGWELRVKPWAPQAKPVVEAFWTEGHPEVAEALARETHFDADFRVLPAGRSLKVQLSRRERGAVRLVSLGLEKYWVDTGEGKREETLCLVVRLNFPPGKPVMAQLPYGALRGGQEHRFYSEAGSYTGIFAGMTPEQARQGVQSLNLISLEGFREAALESGQHVRFEPGVPDNPPRPAPR
jgi:hypothetical protein